MKDKSNVVLLKSEFYRCKEFCFLRLANDEWQFLLSLFYM